MRARPFLATVVEGEEIAEGSRLVSLAAPAAVVAAARAGQFVAVLCREAGSVDPFPRRSLPLAGADAGKGVITVFAADGARGAEWLAGRAVGTTVDVVGPVGNGFAIEATVRRVLIVLDEAGVGPGLFLAEWAVAGGIDVAVAMLSEEARRRLPAWRLPSGAEVVVATDEGIGEQVRWADRVCLAVGATRLGVLKRVLDRQRIGGRPGAAALVERAMPCGTGLCRGCAVATRRGSRLACQDGPVFELDEVAW